MIEIKTYSKPKKTGGSGGSSSSTKYISGVISEAEHAGRADKAKRAEVADQANYAGTAASAQNAAYASEAGSLREDAEILQQYLSLKDTVDPQVVKGMVIFAKGLVSNLLAQLKGGASFGSDGSYSFDKDGNLVIESAHSRDFDEMLQNGFALKRNPTSGKYTLSISDLIVWGRMVINTLETRKKYAIGGNVYLSGASSKIQHVEKVCSEDGETVVGYKCYILKDDGTMATQNGWVVGDQALCQTFDIEEGVYQNVSNQYYWRLVTQVSEENVAITEKYIDKDGNEQVRELYEGQKFAWVVLSKNDCDTNSGVPASGDTIVMDGHRLTENEDTDYTERTNVLMLEATGSGSPRIIALTGIVDYKHDTDNEVFILSPQKVIFTTEHFEIRAASGAPITFVHFMGPWVKGTEYHYYDQVSHANALWTCIVEKGKSTTDEPADGNACWRKEMSGGKGEKGDDAVSYTLEASPGYIRLNSDGSIDYTNGYIDKGDEYGSDKYLVVRGYKVAKGVRDNRFSTEASPVTLRLTINDGSAYSEYTPSDSDSVSIDFEPKYEDSYYSMLEEISHSGLNSVRVDMCEGIEYDPNKILTTCDIPIIRNGKDGQKGDDGTSYNINFVTYKDDVHNDTLLYVYVVRSVGKESTSTLISNIPEISETAGLEVRVYCDGDYNENLTNHVKWSGSIQRSAWETVKNFEVRLYLNDKLVTSNSYSFGEQGEQGESALEIIVTPETLVFDTGDNGLVPPGTSKQASISCYRNGVKVTNVSYNISAEKNCSASVSESNSSAIVTISEITSQEVVDTSGRYSSTISNTSGNSSTISDTSGYTTIQVWDKDTNLYHRVQVKFMVNVAKFTGQMVNTNKRFSLQHEELVTAVKDKVGSSELKKFKAEITQTAREISLSVSEKSIARRNLLVGSACRKYWDGFMYMSGAESGYYDGYPLEQIEKNSGIDGVNCIHCRTKQTGTGSYYLSGFSWHGVSPQGNIKLEKGKNYVLSFYAKTHTPNDIYFTAEVLYQGSKIDTSRPAGYSGPIGYSTTFAASEADKWELFTVKVSVPSNAPYEYVEINIFARGRSYSFVDGYICKPMLEEGENYNGWTLSEQDYDYVGGNLLDNARTLDKSGTLIETYDTVIQNGYGTDSACIKNLMKANATPSDYKEVLRWRFGSTYLVNGNDYIFSFVAKADVDDARVVCYMWSGDIENSCNIFTEDNGGAWDSKGDGNIVFILSRQWTRYWVHWRPKDGYATPKEVIIRHTGNNSTSASTVYVTQPKIEIGATMTEWTERKSDLIDKASLKKAGIEVKSDEVLLYGDRIRVDNNGQTAAMFIGGKLNTDFIDADKIEVKHLWAKSEDGTTKVGYFGNYEINACKVNNTYAPLFIGADTAAKALFYVSKDGYMNAKAGKIGSFLISPTGYANSIIAGTWKDATNIDINKFGTRLELSDTKLEFLYGSGSAINGDVVYSSTNAQIAIDPSKARHGFTSCGLDIRVDVFAASACGIHLDVSSGFLGDPAIYIKNGTVWGFRPHIVSVGSDYHLRDDDTIVMCTNWNNNITLTLPDDPQHGQYYVVIHRGKDITFKSNTDQIMTKDSPSGVSSFGDRTFYQINWIFYDGEQWILIYKT